MRLSCLTSHTLRLLHSPPSCIGIITKSPTKRKIRSLGFQYRHQTIITRMTSSSSASAWECSKCTYLNPPTQKSACQMCLSPLRWSCKACTFSNTFNNTKCEICNTRASPLYHGLGLVSADDDDDDLDASIGSVFLPLQRCKRKSQSGAEIVPDDDGNDQKESGEHCSWKSAKKAVSVSGDTNASSGPSTLKILSYNVWFREDMELHKRMEAIGDLIQQHSPDLICFQEVTPNIYDLFQQSGWWKVYHCSVSNEKAKMRPYFCIQLSKLPVKAFDCKPFSNSIMGRELSIADVDIGAGQSLVVATSHLESPCPAPPRWDQMFSKERVAQAKQAINLLKDSPNVIFCGDMNWDDKLDGAFPLPDGWIDAWAELRSGENGWTYDTKSNPMLSGNRTLQKRLDRFICNLHHFKIIGIDIIGVEAIPGISYCKEKKVRKEVQKLVLPVLPSDHYGLLLTICNI
ncbi:uncharacterized protein LOC131221211 [Magnolia sinica]|uniref:uncharacterized protein LOC131221211 n=1 Tax=Magnolia sinica TaxID=86752 RepID=UPI002659FA30|nr:uncharacterized protein LOC131221211 [Magnolia sinica]